jgi:hypothetical protein
MVGELLKLVDDLGAADNTIVVYTTDNAAEATVGLMAKRPFRGEKRAPASVGNRRTGDAPTSPPKRDPATIVDNQQLAAKLIGLAGARLRFCSTPTATITRTICRMPSRKSPCAKRPANEKRTYLERFLVR